MQPIIAETGTSVIDLLLDALDGGDVRITRRRLVGTVSLYDEHADAIVLDEASSRDEQAKGLVTALAALIELDAVPRRPATPA